jgi:hypothetical protein
MLIPKIEARIIQYLNFLEERAYRIVQELEFEVFETTEIFRTPPQNIQWKPIQSPCPWGKDWTLYWFRTSFQTPQNNGKAIFLSVLPNADLLAFIDEKPAGAFKLNALKLLKTVRRNRLSLGFTRALVEIVILICIFQKKFFLWKKQICLKGLYKSFLFVVAV